MRPLVLCLSLYPDLYIPLHPPLGARQGRDSVRKGDAETKRFLRLRRLFGGVEQASDGTRRRRQVKGSAQDQKDVEHLVRSLGRACKHYTMNRNNPLKYIPRKIM